MMESYRAHYLLTSLAVVKRTCFDQSTGMWVRVQDENTAIICKGWQIFKTTKLRDMWTWIETLIYKELGRNEKKINSNRND